MSGPDPAALILAEPESAFQLSAEDRARLHPVDDPKIVAELLAWFRPEYRAEVLESFTFWREVGETPS